MFVLFLSPMFCLLDFILYVPVNIFSDGSSWVEPVRRNDLCVLLNDTTQRASNPQPAMFLINFSFKNFLQDNHQSVKQRIDPYPVLRFVWPDLMDPNCISPDGKSRQSSVTLLMLIIIYIETCVKRPLSKRPQIGYQN